MQVREHPGDFGHDKHHQKSQDGDGDDQHQHRIHGRIRDLMLQLELAVQEFGKADQNAFQRATRFSCAHHMQIDGRKILGKRFQRTAQRLAAAYLFAYLGEKALDGFLFSLFDEDSQRIDQRQTRRQ